MDTKLLLFVVTTIRCGDKKLLSKTARTTISQPSNNQSTNETSQKLTNSNHEVFTYETYNLAAEINIE